MLHVIKTFNVIIPYVKAYVKPYGGDLVGHSALKIYARKAYTQIIGRRRTGLG